MLAGVLITLAAFGLMAQNAPRTFLKNYFKMPAYATGANDLYIGGHATIADGATMGVASGGEIVIGSGGSLTVLANQRASGSCIMNGGSNVAADYNVDTTNFATAKTITINLASGNAADALTLTGSVYRIE